MNRSLLCLLSLAALTQEVRADQTTLASPHAWFGIRFAFCGDIDEDGIEDLAIGSALGGANRCGEIFYYSIASGELLRRDEAPIDTRCFGEMFTRMPDLDGDCIPEIAAFVGRGGGWGSGGADIEIRSGRTAAILRQLPFGSTAGWSGADLACIGDVDGDDVPDLASVAHLFRGRRSRERISFVSGGTGARLFTFEAPPLGSRLSRRFAVAGDVDGDRSADVAMLVGGEILVVSPMRHEIVWSRHLDLLEGRSGAALFSPGAHDGDGRADLVVGFAYSCSTTGIDEGRARVYSSSDGRPLRTVRPPRRSNFGNDVASPGDIDADGIVDWIVSEQSFMAGGVALISGGTGSLIRRAELDEPGETYPWLGWQVEGGPDVDLDGTPDFAASRIRPRGERGIAGQGVVVFSGRTGKLIRSFVLAQVSGSAVPLPPGVAPHVSSAK